MSESQTSRVVVAMSGGVDSSVAAALLVEQGYEVIGIMMRLWSEAGNGSATALNRCCTPDQMADARRVAGQLDIPFYVIDVRERFRETIVQLFIDEHEAGRTPNPCIACNRQIRFTHLLNHALALDADYLATGHYARVTRQDGRFYLRRALDAAKDQSYVLHVLGQQELARVLFPIGNYTKSEVRQLASAFGLRVAAKHDSQDLCFLSDGDYRRFLREHSLTVNAAGPILDREGQELGRHDGLAFYTIGQRKGLGISAANPLYVLGKDASRNALVVGPREDLGATRVYAEAVNWTYGPPPDRPVRAEVKVRYKSLALPAVVTPLGRTGALVEFDELVFAPTPGQGAVFYDGDVCLGGGIIVAPPQDEPQPTQLPGTRELP